MAIFTDFACFLTPPQKAVSRERREISSPNLVSVLLKPHVNVWLSLKQIQNLTQNGDFAPPAVWRFLRFRLLFNSSRKGPYLENEERSLHQTWSVCYWSPMSMFGWVSNKSKIWPKMVILPHPRYGDFYEFALISLLFNSSLKEGRISRTKRDLFTKLGQCATEAPCQCLVEFETNPKFDPKWWFCPTRGMAIFTDFACFLTPPSKGRLSRTKRDLFTKLGQCATEAPCQCLLEFQTNPKFDPKWWFCPTRGMAIFTDFACFLTPPFKGPSLENEERSLHQTWSVCYWSPMSMFGWVSNKSKIWPKMVILPHPRYGDFYGFRLLFNSSLQRAVSRERREISSPNLVSVLLKPHVNVWLSFKQIQNLTQNGDFAPPAVWRFLPISPAF